MGIVEVLTIVFVVLKLTNVISWSWIAVLAPEIIVVCFYLFAFLVPAAVFNASEALTKFQNRIWEVDEQETESEEED